VRADLRQIRHASPNHQITKKGKQEKYKGDFVQVFSHGPVPSVRVASGYA
jgi:hypothetical protein